MFRVQFFRFEALQTRPADLQPSASGPMIAENQLTRAEDYCKAAAVVPPVVHHHQVSSSVALVEQFSALPQWAMVSLRPIPWAQQQVDPALWRVLQRRDALAADLSQLRRHRGAAAGTADAATPEVARCGVCTRTLPA